MTVHCPHCSTGYLLPDHLIGPGGARVRCPECQGGFAVVHDRIGELGVDAYPRPEPDALSPSSTAPAPSARHERAPAAAAPVAAPAPTPPSAAEVAAGVVDEMVAKVGGAFADARARGKVLSEHGPAIVDAYRTYRERAGDRGAPGVFRVVLKERCGIDLIGRHRT
jgi:predicted Zn finger-like uncharacterized protein